LNKQNIKKNFKTGKLLIFEGLDGSGKSTQISLLSDYLKKIGHEVVTTREPGGTNLANNLRSLMLHNDMDGTTEMLIALAARNDHVARFIKPQLLLGKWVLCDRFTDSTKAYQGSGRGISLDIINILSDNIEKKLNIHKVIFLDITPEKSQERIQSRNIKSDRFESENYDFFHRVRTGFKKAAEDRGTKALWLKGDLSSNEIFNLIKKSIL
jgi:dTMP kinase